MAKINVEFDTVEKTLSVTMDGTAMENVAGISLYPSYDDKDEFRCNVMLATEDEEHDTRTITSIYASEKAQPTEQEKAFAAAGFQVVQAQPDNKLHNEIASFLKKG